MKKLVLLSIVSLPLYQSTLTNDKETKRSESLPLSSQSNSPKPRTHSLSETSPTASQTAQLFELAKQQRQKTDRSPSPLRKVVSANRQTSEEPTMSETPPSLPQTSPPAQLPTTTALVLGKIQVPIAEAANFDNRPAGSFFRGNTPLQPLLANETAEMSDEDEEFHDASPLNQYASTVEEIFEEAAKNPTLNRKNLTLTIQDQRQRSDSNGSNGSNGSERGSVFSTESSQTSPTKKSFSRLLSNGSQPLDKIPETTASYNAPTGATSSTTTSPRKRLPSERPISVGAGAALRLEQVCSQNYTNHYLKNHPASAALFAAKQHPISTALAAITPFALLTATSATTRSVGSSATRYLLGTSIIEKCAYTLGSLAVASYAWSRVSDALEAINILSSYEKNMNALSNQIKTLQFTVAQLEGNHTEQAKIVDDARKKTEEISTQIQTILRHDSKILAGQEHLVQTIRESDKEAADKLNAIRADHQKTQLEHTGMLEKILTTLSAYGIECARIDKQQPTNLMDKADALAHDPNIERLTEHVKVTKGLQALFEPAPAPSRSISPTQQGTKERRKSRNSSSAFDPSTYSEV